MILHYLILGSVGLLFIIFGVLFTTVGFVSTIIIIVSRKVSATKEGEQATIKVDE